MNATTIAIDLAKNVFEVAVSSEPGRIDERRRLARGGFLRFFANRPPATVLLESCGSAHHWAREIRAYDHDVVLIPPHLSRPYRTHNKTDRTDAKALLEAYRNEEIHPVPVKTVDQQAVTALHRLRSSWNQTRTARINTLRGLLRELGTFLPVGSRGVVPRVRALVEDPEARIPGMLRQVFFDTCTEIRDLEQRIKSVELQLKSVARQDATVKRLLTVPGIGLLTATALVGFVGNAKRFPTARHFASYLGLTPREHSSGSKRHLSGITKRGDVYLRMLLTHGGRSVLRAAKVAKRPDRLRSWALEVERTRGHNKATIAVANKLARIAWAVWNREDDFNTQPAAA